MRAIINAKTGAVVEEEYTPPIPTEEEQKQQRISDILFELSELDGKIRRVDEDILEAMYEEFGYMPYSATADIINHKEDLRDELKTLRQEVQNEGNN